MKIVYTDYSEDTLNDREISKKLVEDTIKNPNEIVEGKKERLVAHKLVGKKLLRVMYEKEANVYIVVTAYYTYPVRYMKK